MSKNSNTVYQRNCKKSLKHKVLVSGKKPIPDPGSRGQKGTKKIVKKLINIRSWDPGTGSATNLSNQEQQVLAGAEMLGKNQDFWTGQNLLMQPQIILGLKC